MHPRAYGVVRWFGAFACWLTGSTFLLCAEPELLMEARQALAESIPQIAIAKLDLLRRDATLSVADQNSSALLRSEALLALGRFDDALREVEPLASSEMAGASRLKAHTLAAAGRWPEALLIYEKLADLPGAPAEAHLGLAESLYAAGRIGKAIEALEAFTRANPQAVRVVLSSLAFRVFLPLSRCYFAAQ